VEFLESHVSGARHGALGLNGLGPADEKRNNIARRAEPDFGFSLSQGGADERTEAARTECPDDAKGGFVREIVAEESNRRIGFLFGQNCGCGSAFVATDAEFDASFKFEQRKAFEVSEGFKKLSGAALDALGNFAGFAAPVHHDPVGFVFKEAAESVATQLLAKLFKVSLGGCGGVFELAAAIGIEALGTVKTPHLERRFEPEEWSDFAGGTAGDDGHAGLALTLNAGKRITNAGIGARSEAIDAKGSQCAVVVEQQDWTAGSGKPGEKAIELLLRGFFLCDFFLIFERHRLAAYVESLSLKSQAFFNCAILCTLFSVRKCWASLPLPESGSAHGETMIESAIKNVVWSVQEYTLYTWRAVLCLFSPPVYWTDTLVQADTIGAGSAGIVALTGFFLGAVLALESDSLLAGFGATGYMGRFVGMTMLVELGPVLTGIIVSGRNASTMASELGSMVVTEQVDAMNALGVDPVRKLVTPRLVATVITLPLLTLVANAFGLLGGGWIAVVRLHIPMHKFITDAYSTAHWPDVFEGLIKPVVFAFILASDGCFYGMRTTGGAEGVSRSTIHAVVTASLLILIADFLISHIMIQLFP
jgi:phospholipid/cholesterol/gamma-HCH transport system permease protein